MTCPDLCGQLFIESGNWNGGTCSECPRGRDMTDVDVKYAVTPVLGTMELELQDRLLPCGGIGHYSRAKYTNQHGQVRYTEWDGPFAITPKNGSRPR